MESVGLFQNITIDDVLMVVLTGIIAWSVLWQARYTKRLAEISVQTEQRVRERNKPEVKLVQCRYDYQTGDEDTWKSFVGFSITNASPFDVIITSISLGLGIPVDRIRGPFTSSIQLSHIDRHRGATLSDCSLPRRLQHGESMRILYDEDEAIGVLKREGGGQPARCRPQCGDSLGNRHTMDHWVVWEKNSTAGFPDPGPGLIAEEQLVKSRPSKKNKALRSVYTRLFRRQQRTP